MVLAIVLSALAAYILGATPFGLLAGKLKGVDIREHGSGNIGATNVYRVLGKTIGICVFLLDFLKGYLPVLFATHFVDSGTLPAWGPIVVALATILGHNYTLWLGFKGGKGIATSGGAILGLMPAAVGVAVLVWIALMVVFRRVSLASIGAALAIPITVAVLGSRAGMIDGPLLAFAIAVCLLAILRHRSNISRLIAGTEPRVGDPAGKKD